MLTLPQPGGAPIPIGPPLHLLRRSGQAQWSGAVVISSLVIMLRYACMAMIMVIQGLVYLIPV